MQVHLGDLPANISGRRLGSNVFKAGLINLGLVTLAAAGAIAGEIMHVLPGVFLLNYPIFMCHICILHQHACFCIDCTKR